MKDITEWEVLTPEGWKDFSGVVKFKKHTLTIYLENGTKLTGSLEHRVMTNFGMNELQKLQIGDIILISSGESKVSDITEIKEEQDVFDLVGVESAGSQYFTNGIISHNCDEMGFIPNRVQAEFMAGTTPALSATRGKMIVTSTPNGSRDLFAKLWFGTGMEWDKQDYTYIRHNEPKNLFTPLFVPYWIDPTKNNDEWITREKKTLDDEVKWKVEFECLSEHTRIDVYDKLDGKFKTLSLQEMSIILAKDMLDSLIIINDEGIL